MLLIFVIPGFSRLHVFVPGPFLASKTAFVCRQPILSTSKLSRQCTGMWYSCKGGWRQNGSYAFGERLSFLAVSL